MQPVKTIDDVEIEIKHAILVLKALPRVGPRNLRSWWPDMLEEKSIEKVGSYYIKPLPEEIDDMDLVFENWFKVLDFFDRYIVFNRLNGTCWKTLMRRLNLSRSCLYLRYKNSLKKIFNHVLEEQSKSEQKNGKKYDA